MKASELEEKTLREPVDRGVRLVALALIDDAQHAAAKLAPLSNKLADGDAEADEALHDFRVQLRRLRAWIRAFKPWLRADISRKRRRGLSKIADATRETRDATVHLEWLHSARPALSPRQRVGHTWMLDQLEKRRADSSEDSISAANDFESMAPKLARRLQYYRTPVSESDAGERFGAIYSQRVLKQSKELRDRLADVHRFSDVKQAHRARIAAKNLRYVIEPVAKIVVGGEAIIEKLKGLQDLLGDLHDVHVFGDELVAATEKSAGSRARRVSEVVLTEHQLEEEEDRVRSARARDPGPGLFGLARRLHERGTQAFDALERQWLNDTGAELFEQVRVFAEHLSSCASAGAEIEHKYLLKSLPAAAADAPSVEIEQGYLPGKKVLERIRRVQLPDGGRKWFRTVKLGNGVERIELEEEADPELSRVMWDLTRGRRLRKRRYSIRESDGVVWEVDEFLDRNLVLAEIELPSVDTNFELPEWMRDVLDREVTDEPEYSNARLAESSENGGRKENGDRSPSAGA